MKDGAAEERKGDLKGKGKVLLKKAHKRGKKNSVIDSALVTVKMTTVGMHFEKQETKTESCILDEEWMNL